MRILPGYRVALVCFYLSLIFAATFCYEQEKTVDVVGIGECADCAPRHIMSGQAFSGLRVTIDCKPKNGHFKTRGTSELDNEGKFIATLPNAIIEDGKLKEECYAQLHSASSTPCPAYNGLESSKIMFKSNSNEKNTLGLTGSLKFSRATCTSACFWPYPPLPMFPPLPPWYLPPKIFQTFPPFPPNVFPPETLPPPVPKAKKPLPPPVPKPKKLVPPPVPKPKMPLPPPVTIFKKPLPPPIPIPKILPPIPFYKPKPPIFYKPIPPIPKLPSFPKFLPYHFGKWPPLQPFFPIH